MRAESIFRFSVMHENARPFSPDFIEMTIALSDMISSSSESVLIADTRSLMLSSAAIFSLSRANRVTFLLL